MPSRDENIIDYIFRAKDAEKVQRAAQDLADAFSRLKPATEGASGELDELDQEAREAAQAQERLDNSTRSLGDRLRSLSTRDIVAGYVAAKAVLATFQKVLRAVGDTFEFTVGKAAIQEQAIVRLEAAMRSAGTFSRKASADFQAFASELQQTTQFGDEQIITLGALITQIGRLKGDALERATVAALDLQAALGKTEREVGVLFGKLAQGETGTLSEIGIVIDQTLPRAEKFEAALTAIEQAFGGTAQATVKTYSGAVQQLSNAWGDLGETIGFVVLPHLTRLAQGLTDNIQRVQGFFSQFAGTADDSATQIARAFDSALSDVRQATGKTEDDLRRFINTATRDAELKIRTEVQTTNLEDAIGLVEELEASMRTATNAATREFQQFRERLIEAASEAIEQKIRITSASAQNELGAILGKFREEITLKARIEGAGGFREAAAAIEAADERASSYRERLEALREELRGLTDEAKTLSDLPGIIPEGKDSERVKKLREEIASLEAQSLAFPDKLREKLDTIRAELEATGAEREIRVDIKARIEAAETTDELEELLRGLDEAVTTTSVRASQSLEAIPIGEAVKRTRDYAAELISVKQAQLETAESADAQAAALERLIVLFRTLSAIAGEDPLAQFSAGQFISGTVDAEKAAARLNEVLTKLWQTGSPEQLLAAYDALKQSVEGAEDGVVALDDQMLQTMQARLADIELLLEAMDLLERPRIIDVSVDTKKAKKDADEGGKELEKTITGSLDKISTEGASAVFDAFFQNVVTRSEESFLQVEKFFTRLIDSMIAQLLRLAALSIFRWLINTVAPGAGDVFFTVGNAASSRAEKPGGFVDATGGTIQFDGGLVRDSNDRLIRSYEGAQAQTTDAIQSLAVQLQLQQLTFQSRSLLAAPRGDDVLSFIGADENQIVQRVEIRAIDTADVERWFRDGPGGRAIGRLAASRGR